jgi:hypothetical protein
VLSVLLRFTDSDYPFGKSNFAAHQHDEKVYETITYLFTHLIEHAGKTGDYEKLALHYTLSAGLKFMPKTMDTLIKIAGQTSFIQICKKKSILFSHNLVKISML